MFRIPSKSVIDLNNCEPHTLLFIIPGIEGNCDVFKNLSESLEKYKIKVLGLEFNSDVPTDSIQSASVFHFDTIKRVLSNYGNSIKYSIAGYSFGGLIAIDICRQIQLNNDIYKHNLMNLILFDSSHKLLRISVHVNAKQFGLCISNKDIFKYTYIYTGSLAMVLSYMINNPSKSLRQEIYNYLNKEPVANLDEAIEKAFQYIIDHSIYEFIDDSELKNMKVYLRYILIKSNAGLKYDYDFSNRLDMPVILIKSPKFMYKDQLLDEIYYRNDYESDIKNKITINKYNYSLDEIVHNSNKNLKVLECENGNHWTFIDENHDFLSDFIVSVMRPVASKL